MTTNPEVLRLARSDWLLIKEYIDAKIADEIADATGSENNYDLSERLRLRNAEQAIDHHLRQSEKDNSDAD